MNQQAPVTNVPTKIGTPNPDDIYTWRRASLLNQTKGTPYADAAHRVARLTDQWKDWDSLTTDPLARIDFAVWLAENL